MRRWILKWALWLSMTAVLGAISLEAASFLVPRAESFLAIGQHFYALLRPGWIDLSSGLDSQARYPAPMTVIPRNIIAPKVVRSGSVNLPGFSLTFCLFRNAPAMWSAKVSLFVPLVLSLFAFAIVFHRLKRLQGRDKASLASATSSLR